MANNCAPHKTSKLTGIELAEIRKWFPYAEFTKRHTSVRLGALGDTRLNTADYIIYKHEDGYRARRIVLDLTSNDYLYDRYQLFRDSRKQTWESYDNVRDICKRIDKYISKHHR